MPAGGHNRLWYFGVLAYRRGKLLCKPNFILYLPRVFKHWWWWAHYFPHWNLRLRHGVCIRRSNQPRLLELDKGTILKLGSRWGHAKKTSVVIEWQVLEGMLRKSGHGQPISRLWRFTFVCWQLFNEPGLADCYLEQLRPHRDVLTLF